ncbi:MAG: SDR family oxidoreductase [Deltaproteobacteria bacterium]|nr:SDR family oxidoreductase [Deltaproteobacteria bacterium]
MRVVILGVRGMLGHVLARDLSSRFEVVGTMRGPVEQLAALRGADVRLIGGVVADDLATVARALDDAAADVVVNCIGIVKQRVDGNRPAPCIRINALFPHELAALAARRGMRLVHFSTDCVFSGSRGPSKISDPPDPIDVYGRSKWLGEVDEPNAITLRTSLVGRELDGHLGLVDWFLRQPAGSEVRGFRRALFSGMSTTTAARIVGSVILDHRELRGVWQVASEGISKHDLLCLLRDAFKRQVTVFADDVFACDRRLDGDPFAARTGLMPPSWPDMVREILDDSPQEP